MEGGECEGVKCLVATCRARKRFRRCRVPRVWADAGLALGLGVWAVVA